MVDATLAAGAALIAALLCLSAFFSASEIAIFARPAPRGGAVDAVGPRGDDADAPALEPPPASGHRARRKQRRQHRDDERRHGPAVGGVRRRCRCHRRYRRDERSRARVRRDHAEVLRGGERRVAVAPGRPAARGRRAPARAPRRPVRGGHRRPQPRHRRLPGHRERVPEPRGAPRVPADRRGDRRARAGGTPDGRRRVRPLDDPRSGYHGPPRRRRRRRRRREPPGGRRGALGRARHPGAGVRGDARLGRRTARGDARRRQSAGGRPRRRRADRRRRHRRGRRRRTRRGRRRNRRPAAHPHDRGGTSWSTAT